ncbi:unnamed protein product [Parascedosporium putredinis]|uniref:Senescence domain-containing protein n=1 Tax=Parascedosporium putredinis TaxID=1442378 RepID=A0A9P1MCR9_9PEZI|nr:unnamed protein product [Parascedosporium putredinis]CAI7998918.1 unnamed protein product [Parascedosporium putredinis]
MAGTQHDPKLLYAIEGVRAYHIVNGSEESLTASGPQTLSLLMVPTSSPFADASQIGAAENDFYLHLHLPPELDLPLPATTQIYHQPPCSYLIPRSHTGGGRIVLVDEEDGSVIGELGEAYQIVEDSAVKPGSKEPVEFSLPLDGGQIIAVHPASQEYVEMEMHPSYKKSSLVSTASKASRLIVSTSDMVTKVLQNQAESFTKSTKPVAEPVTFTPAAHDRIRKINHFSTKAAHLSSTTVGRIGQIAQNVGAGLTKKRWASRGMTAAGIQSRRTNREF